MATSTQGYGRSFPNGGTDRQVPVIDTTSGVPADLKFADNGTRRVISSTGGATITFGDVVAVDATSAAAFTLPALDGVDHASITIFTAAGSSDITVTGPTNGINGSTTLVVTTTPKTFVAKAATWVAY